MAEKDNIWNYAKDSEYEKTGEGVERTILCYSENLMLVENHFKKGAVGALHHHPHTQATYIIEGAFEFEVDGEKHVVRKGDVLLKQNDIVHGCVCLEDGILLDVFTPMREDFIK